MSFDISLSGSCIAYNTLSYPVPPYYTGTLFYTRIPYYGMRPRNAIVLCYVRCPMIAEPFLLHYYLHYVLCHNALYCQPLPFMLCIDLNTRHGIIGGSGLLYLAIPLPI